ncbi:hypothetical protein FQN57_002494 [Myotisia sp. PD_48]|nr:hypothetical protein FQN57_002494 [Myotisia sp. PD_48]
MNNQLNGKAFLNYPDPKRGQVISHQNKKKNPVLTGIVLIIATLLFKWFAFIRRMIWKNAGFGTLRPIRQYLEDYEPRFDPTVIPTSDQCDVAGLGNDVPCSSTILEPVVPARTNKLPPLYYTISDYHSKYMSGELTPTAVAKALLPLILRDTEPPGEHSIAWIEVNKDLILVAAEASTQRYKRKCHLGILDGVPTAIKDEYDADGYKTTLGALNDYRVEAAAGESTTSWCVKMLEESGAIILGKLSMHEFGLDTSGNNPHYGTPLNPYNPKYYPGGSSSGSAYAVSAGLIPFSLGSDGGGSIRIPSSFCSVYGLKPTHNRISHLPAANHSNTCSVNGPIAADLQSLSILYRVIGCPHPTSHFPAVPSRLSRPLPADQKVLGISQVWFSQATPAIQRLCRSIIDQLVSKHKYSIIPIDIPFLAEGQIAHAMTVLTDAATLLPNTDNISAPNKILCGIGSVTPSTDYLLAQKLRRLLMQHLAYLWKQYPGMIIVTPTTGCAGWPIRSKSELEYGISDGDTTLKTMEYVWMANFLGLPSLSIPAGFVIPEGARGEGSEAGEETEGKIPVGLMGMGEWASEEHLIHWGLDAADVSIERRSKPPIWVDVMQRAKQVMEMNPETN